MDHSKRMQCPGFVNMVSVDLARSADQIQVAECRVAKNRGRTSLRKNLGSDKDVDFLRLALADEIATTLSYARSLSICPFATTSKYDSP